MSILVCLFAAALSSRASARDLAGRWDGVVHFENVDIRYEFEIAGSGDNIVGSFFNGDERVSSTRGQADGDAVTLFFDHYLTRVDAKLEDGVLKGTYGNSKYGVHRFEAVPHKADPAPSGTAPEIGGLWQIQNESAKGEHAWRFIVNQNGGNVSAAILRVDGDTGLLKGTWQRDRFVLYHFDGARALAVDVVPCGNETLEVTLKGFHALPKPLTAVRPSTAKAQGLPGPADFTAHTRVKDPDEPFRFGFPDLSGEIVSNTDARFRNKVVVVNVTGSWCPNCHDEAPFLAELYRRYRALGLEIVALDFEEPEQQKDPKRLPAFIRRYGIEYPYLIAGEPSELTAKIPQATNLNSWPTTFILGRDGKVRKIHAGFAAPASGEFHEQLKREFRDTIEQLLAENAVTRVR